MIKDLRRHSDVNYLTRSLLLFLIQDVLGFILHDLENIQHQFSVSSCKQNKIIRSNDLQFVHRSTGMTNALLSNRSTLARIEKTKFRTTDPGRGSIGTRHVNRRVQACFGKPKAEEEEKNSLNNFFCQYYLTFKRFSCQFFKI